MRCGLVGGEAGKARGSKARAKGRSRRAQEKEEGSTEVEGQSRVGGRKRKREGSVDVDGGSEGTKRVRREWSEYGKAVEAEKAAALSTCSVLRGCIAELDGEIARLEKELDGLN